MNNIFEQNTITGKPVQNQGYSYQGAPKKKKSWLISFLFTLFWILVVIFALPAMYIIGSIVNTPKCESFGGVYKGGDIGCVDPTTRQYIDLGTGERRASDTYTGSMD